MSITRMRKSFAHILKPVLLLIAAIFVVGAIWSFGTAPGRQTAKEAGRDVVAVVNGQRISRAEFDEVYRAQLVNAEKRHVDLGPTRRIDLKNSILSTLIFQHLMLAAAHQQGISVGWFEARRERAKMIKETMDMVRRQAAAGQGKKTLTDSELDEVLRNQDPPYTIDSLREEIEKTYTRDAVQQQVMVRKLYDKLKAKVGPIDDNRLRDCYREVQGREILISTTTMPNAQARRLAGEILTQIKAGADFAALARKFSDSPDASKTGGLIKSVWPAVDRDFRGVKDGQVSPVVKTEFGYRIVKVESSKLPPEFDKKKKELRKSLKEHLEAEVATDFDNKIEKTAKVEVRDPELRGYWLYSKYGTMYGAPKSERDKILAQAIDSLRRATREDSDDPTPEPRIRLAMLYRVQNKLDDAIAELTDVLDGRRLADDPELRMMLAEMLIDKGDAAKARGNLEIASDEAYTNPDQMIHERIKSLAEKIKDAKLMAAEEKWLKEHAQPGPTGMFPPGTRPAPTPAPKPQR